VTLPHWQRTSYKLNVFIGAQKVVPFGNIQTKIFRELLMSKLRLLIRDPKVEKSVMEWDVGIFHFLENCWVSIEIVALVASLLL